MPPTVVIVGGGYGGVAAARALDDEADVILVEPRDAFVHNVAALRGLVDPAWTDRIFMPYGRLLDRGRVITDRVVAADVTGVTLGSGEKVAADYLVLATGSAYPFPGKTGEDESAVARSRLRAGREALAEAAAVLLLGAGPVGLELAGEIKSAWPAKAVTIVDPVADVLSGDYPPEFRAELRRQLAELGIELVLGAFLREEPPYEAGRAKTFTVTTRAGRPITADIWFRCHGVRPATGYLSGGRGELGPARRASGYLAVTPELRLPGHRHVFAIGDIASLPEGKLASAAGRQARVVAENIRALIAGSELTRYQPGPGAVSVPLGPAGGASYLPGTGVLGAAETARIKGEDLRVGAYAELFRLG